MSNRTVHSIVVALLTGAFIAVPATGAAAATTPITGGGSFARTVPFIDGWIYAFECHAVAPGALTTTVDSCSMSPYGPITAPKATATGPFAITYGSASTNPAGNYTLCWTVSATYSGGATQSTSGCTAASSIAAAG
jgi:hypothetical protein